MNRTAETSLLKSSASKSILGRVDSAEKSKVIWLSAVCFTIIVLVIFGGYVRLTRSGLSIVEWNVITGVVPPLSQSVWEAEFAKYQQSPEFLKININMSLDEYKSIYFNEWFHRLLGRVAGLLFVVPLFYYLVRGKIPWRKSGIYLGIGLMFAFQGFLGWYMVSSGLIDRPSVSHYRLAAHLVTAIILLGTTFWAALNYLYPDKPMVHSRKRLVRLAALFMALVMTQITYGAFVAGLKAGFVSNTWPLMAGQWVPNKLLWTMDPWWVNLLASPFAVHFVHRWFAIIVLAGAVYVYYAAKKQGDNQEILTGAKFLGWLVVLQITFGVSVVWFGVPIWLALVHQGTALLIFLADVYLLHRLSKA